MTTVSSRYLLTLVHQLQHIGVADDLITATLQLGLDEIRRCAKDNKPLPLKLYSSLYQLYLQQMKAENFAFPDQVGENLGRYQMLLVLMVNSDTLKSALRKLHDFYQTFAITDQLIHYHSADNGQIACELTILMQDKYRNTEQQTTIAANLAAGFHRILCWLTETRLPLQAVFLEGKQPRNDGNYNNLFNCPVHFAQTATQLQYDEQVLDFGIVQNEQSLTRFLANYPTLLFDPPETGEQAISQKIQALVVHNLKDRLLNIEEISHMLGMTSSQVKITLKKEHTSFHKLLERIRKEQAQELLTHSTLELELIAELLGFPATSAFHRSFKRWTGATPGEFRKNSSGQ
ncbi:AraC family transcriptional regulator [Deltaproteobacteria bacterium]|nr:AraC family transcriptional regulator [Deltaproteobacteria bacterium]